MHFPLFISALLSLGVFLAPQTSAALVVRSIQVRFIATTNEPASPIGTELVAKALKSRRIGLALEERFDSGQLGKASDVIRDLYGDTGRKVRVEYSVTHMPPRGVEAKFDVIELCSCE